MLWGGYIGEIGGQIRGARILLKNFSKKPPVSGRNGVSWMDFDWNVAPCWTNRSKFNYTIRGLFFFFTPLVAT